MAAGIKIPTIFIAKDSFTGVVKQMTKSVKKFSKTGTAAIKRFDSRVSQTMNKLGNLAKIGLGVGAGMVISSSINIVKDYEQAVADLSAVMNASKEDQDALAKESVRLGSVTAKSATEVVGLQEAYARLGFPTQDIINMTEATINGSIAMNAELADTAELTGAMISTFDSMSSIDADKVLNQMTLATQKTALNFTKLQSGLPNVAGAANAAGVDFETLLSLLGKLSDAGIDASASGTALKNIFIQAKAKGADYNEILSMISNSSDKLTASNNKFGKIAAVSGTILAGKLKEVSTLTGKLKKDFDGVATEAAGKRLATFGGSLTLLESAWEGLLLKTNEGTGAMSIMQDVVVFVTENIETLASVVVGIIGAFVLMKVVVLASTLASTAYSVAMGIAAARTGAMSIAMKGNIVAQGAFKVAMFAGAIATKVMTASQWLLNVALNANPIGLIIVGIIALIAVVVVIIKYYDEWGAALSMLLGPFGLIISIIQSFRRNWEMVKEAFTNGGFIEGLKAIGKVLLDAILMPVQQLLTLLSNIPGLGDIAGKGAEYISEIRANLGVDTGENSSADGEVLPSTAQASNSEVIQRSETKNSLEINVRDKGNNVESVKQNGGDDIGIKTGSTVGAS